MHDYAVFDLLFLTTLLCITGSRFIHLTTTDSNSFLLMEYYSAMRRNEFEPVVVRWVNLEPVIQSKVVRKSKSNTA